MTYYYGNYRRAKAVARRMNRNPKIKGNFYPKKTKRGSYRVVNTSWKGYMRR